MKNYRFILSIMTGLLIIFVTTTIMGLIFIDINTDERNELNKELDKYKEMVERCDCRVN